jgi:hypothetical protein
MTRTTKILLAISLTAFAFGVTGGLWGFGTPVGAIFFGLFMICKLFGKETALYDEEQKLRAAQAPRASNPVARSAQARSVALTPAAAHSR